MTDRRPDVAAIPMPDLKLKAQKLRDSTIETMTMLGISPTAEHYMIWYRDAAGDYPDLSHRLRQLVAHGQAFTDELCTQLYERFFGADQRAKAVEKTCSQLEATMDRVLLQIAGASDRSNRYGDSLSMFQDHLAQCPELHEMRRLAEDVLRETQQMHEATVELKSILADSTKEIAQLSEDLAAKSREAETDGLTGIANRRRLETVFASAAEEARETQEPMCLLLVDIDHFKEFNDAHGHLIGDQVLKIVAKTLTQCIKGGDLAARYGGEEFAFILPRTDLDGAIAIANHIRETIARSRVRLKTNGQDLGHITLSGGCALYKPGDSFSDIVERADAALYKAKRAGRNQIQPADPPTSPTDGIAAA